MSRPCVLVGLCVLAGALAIGSGYGQDKKDPQPVVKVQLPANWGKIGLTADQKKVIYTVLGNYEAKIDALKEQMEALKKEKYVEAYKLLNDDQKTALKKLGDKFEPGKDDKKPTDKKPEEK